ncbi:glycosyltransferase family 2 protein [Glaciecola siphonariae]|uniref:Glycosyltransferase family 2 protein n=1 Tax=Glaciecola siphonariae TaxID=521012 RepID=A0ABV9LZ18_9ALTE
MSLAPIAISTYSRLEHLKLTVSALQKNTLAQQSELFILSDAPRPGDEQLVQRLRAYADSVSEFARVKVIKRTSNGRVANSRGGMHQLMREYGKVIFLEDDIVTAPGFLQFMNDALVEYEHHPDVLSICGYSPPLPAAQQSESDVFALPRMIAWGMGLWLPKFEKIKAVPLDEFKALSSDARQIEILNSEYGRDLLNRYKAEAYGHIDGLDNRGCYLQMKANMVTVYPKQSLVANKGNDGSGQHASITNKFDVELWQKEHGFQFNNALEVDRRIRAQSIEFFAPTEKDMSPHIIDNILSQIQGSGIKEIVLWGTDILTSLFLDKLTTLSNPPKVMLVVDSWAEKGDRFQTYKVLTPSEAYAKGHRIFVIMSFASRMKIADAVYALGKDCSAIKYEDGLE